ATAGRRIDIVLGTVRPGERDFCAHYNEDHRTIPCADYRLDTPAANAAGHRTAVQNVALSRAKYSGVCWMDLSLRCGGHALHLAGTGDSDRWRCGVFALGSKYRRLAVRIRCENWLIRGEKQKARSASKGVPR